MKVARSEDQVTVVMSTQMAEVIGNFLQLCDMPGEVADRMGLAPECRAELKDLWHELLTAYADQQGELCRARKAP